MRRGFSPSALGAGLNAGRAINPAGMNSFPKTATNSPAHRERRGLFNSRTTRLRCRYPARGRSFFLLVHSKTTPSPRKAFARARPFAFYARQRLDVLTLESL